MPTDKAIKLYKAYFWDKGNFDSIIYPELAIKLFDLSVTMGIKKCITLLQKSYNLIKNASLIIEDGILGQSTAAAINSIPLKDIYDIFIQEAAKFYVTLGDNNDRYKPFVKGWLNRVNDYPKLS